jgi:uncharacterized protein (DUF1499 family)
MDAFFCLADIKKVMGILAAEVATLNGAKLIKKEKNYLHFTFRTPILRFIDDVEFELDEKKLLIHFKSASRIGYSDLGANRKRMDMIRTHLISKRVIRP